ncbi:hypothetical protein [Sediminibacterium salmoneum]|uniref:hypothetical protein n=1 Tax=Sediminibacterium salmoneum TaxID=426421 RepID=UPI00047A780A|nr:hypothetical protein [Sediminibacterium salmoneum]
MDHIYEEIKNRHHQKFRLSAAVISSIVFTYLVTVFLLLTNSIVENASSTNKSLVGTQFTAKSNLKESTTRP